MEYKSGSLLNQAENLLSTIPKDTQKKLLERAIYKKGLGSTINGIFVKEEDLND